MRVAQTEKLENELADVRNKASDRQREFVEGQKAVDEAEDRCFEKEKKVEALEQKFVAYQKNMFSYGYGGPQMIQAPGARYDANGDAINRNNNAEALRAVAKLKGDLDEFKAATKLGLNSNNDPK